MTDVNANIGINFDTKQALAQLRDLQAGLSRFNQALTQGNVAAASAQKGLNDQLMQAINSTGKFVASQKEIATSTASFTSALEKNQLSMREYFRYTGAAATANTKTFTRMFQSEREIINRARKDRVKLLQSQYIQLGAANGELVKVLQVVPKHLEMVNGRYTDYATRVQMAAQRQQFLNQLLKQGSTQLLNFGKNTQWAGRQLMVGLTIPLTMLGSIASKTFLEMEQAVLKFTRVYGDITTSGDATNKALKDIQTLGKEFTKYGIAVKDTVEMAATAAAMGLTGGALNSQVIAATRLAVLGQVEQQQALETTISLQNAFGISSEQLAQKIDFLNAVENQTVLSIEDLTIAIPKAGPVVKQLGGDVEDLAFFMTAMKEGGINASEGANALKSGLASMINPAKKTSEFLASLGINIKGIVDNNAGNLKGTVVGLARALDTLDPLNRARAIEQLFGKFQFARLSTLFQNVTKDSSQAARALGLAGASVEELAILSERELKKVEDSTGAKFKKAMENLKNELIPVGKAFLEALTPVIKFVGNILERFNGLSEGTKKAITVMIGVIGGLAPIALMTFGLLANGAANLIKFFAMLRGGIAKLNGSNMVLGGGFDYLTNQQIENMAETNALHTSHQQLISTFNLEKGAIDSLAAAYTNASTQARALAASSPGLFNTVPGAKGAVAGLPPKKFATGGVVPGTGNKDTVPALLTPGEVVITKQTAKENPELVAALQNGSVMKYSQGTGKTGTQTNPGRTGFDIGGETFGLAISPKSDKIVSQVEKLATAMQDGSLGIENGADILKEVFARLADDSRVTLTEFVQEVRIATKEMSGVELTPAQINTAAGATGANSKIAGHSATEAGVSKNVRDQMYAAGRGEEFERLQKIANNTGDRLASERPDLPALQRPDKKNVQLDRGHIGAIGTTEKGVQEGWDPDLWDLSTHAENEMAQTLASNNDARRVYLEKLKQSSATEEEILSISQKVTSNGALNERELQIQKEVLGGMLSDKEFMAAEQKKSGKGKPMSIEKTMLATVYDAEGRAATPLPDSVDTRSQQERLESGRAKVRSRFGKNNSGDNKDGFIPLSDAERQAKLDSIKISDAVDADLTAAETKAETRSPSKRTKRLGKDIADGLALGLEEGKASVKSQSSDLTDAALPSAAETQAKVDKMDLSNKAFYDDIDTPEMRDQRQILKSQDRQRRKLGATGTVDSVSESTVPSQTSSLIIASSKRTAEAADQLAIKTEEAVAAESQVVQQIRDESKTRVKIKGNTINIGKAREDADKAENEAAITRARAAAIEKEQAAQRAKNSPTTITDEQVKAAKEKANEAEIRYAEARQKWAEAEIANAENIDVSDESVAAPGKIQQIINEENETQADALISESRNREALAEQSENQAGISEGMTDTLIDVDENARTSATALGTTSDNLVTQSALSESIALTDAQRAQEAQETAATQAKIHEAKQAELRAAQENARQEAADASIPGGSQADGPAPGEDGFIGPLTASQQADKDRADSRLRRKQERSEKRGLRKEKVGRYSGKVSGALGAATMVAGMAGAPPQVTAALGAMSMVAQMAPMLAGLSGPQGIVAAVVAAGASLYLLNKHFQAAARAQAKFVRDISATTDKMKKIGEFTGTVGASELMAKRREGGFNTGYIPRERKGQEFGITFAEGDIGKQMSKSFVASMEKFGSREAAKIFGLELAAYVADGVLTAEQAQGIAFAIGSQFKDQNIVVDIEAQLSNVIGMNGEDLTRDPLELRLRLVSEGNKQVQRELDGMKNIVNNTTLSGADEAARFAAFQVSSVTLAQTAADSIQKHYEDEKKILEAQLKQTANKEEQVKIQTKLTKLIADAADSEQIMNTAVIQQINNSIAQFDAEIRTANSGMFNDLARRENAYFDSLKQGVRSAVAGTGMEKDADRMLERTARIADDAYQQGFTNNYETGESAFDQGQDLEVKINMLVANKLISPTQANSFLDLFEGNLKDLETTLDVGIQSRGAGKTAELLSMMTRFEDKDSARIMAMNITLEDNETFDRLSNILGLANLLDGKEIDMDSMFGGTSGESRLRVLDEQFSALTAQTDALGDKEITTDFLVNFDAQYGTDTSKADLDFIKKEFAGDKKGQVNALRTYEMISQFVNSVKFDSPEAQKMFEQEAERRLIEGFRNRENRSQTFEEYRNVNYALLLDDAKSDFQLDKDGFIQTRFKAVIGTTPKVDNKGAGVDTGGNKGDKKNPLDFLDDLAMRIKNVRDGAFDATKPLQSMLAAFTSKKAQKDASRMFDIFDGLQQRLIGLNVPKEFRDVINGMSAEDFKELSKLTGDKAVFKFKKGKPRTKANIEGLTDTGRAVARTYREASLGDANVVNKETVLNIQNQEKAFRMLIANGVSAADALKQVEDTGLAAAIATGTLGKKGSKEWKQYVEDLKKANTETERFALSQKMITANEEFKLLEKMPMLSTAMKSAGLSADQMSEVLNDPALARHLIEDLKDGKVDAKDIADYLNSIEAKKMIDIQVKFNAGQYSESAKPGMDIVDEMFAVQENLLRTGADPRTTDMVDTMNANNKAIKAAEAEANKFRRQIELINREIEKDQRVIEEKYTRPIEDMTEEINDLNRELETNPLFGDRAIETLNKENTMLSNDLSLISNAAEKINEKYDEQAEALQKVSDINENITRQQEGQLDLADALTQGDISAAARAMQASRADAASMFQGTVSDALDQSRQNEIDNLRGPESGLTQKEIQERQFEISQKIYDMETDPARLSILEQIRVKQDAIYDLEELREKALIKIREKEDAIYKIQKDQLTPLEDKIEDLTYQNALIQEAIDKLVEETTVLDKTKLEWERIKARIDANALASKNLNGDLGALLASTSAIDAKWADILAKLAEYNGTPQGVLDAQAQVDGSAEDYAAFDSSVEALSAAESAMWAAEDALNAAYDTGQWAKFAELQRALEEAKKKVADATEVYDSASEKITGPVVEGETGGGGGPGGRFGFQMMSKGGMVKPNYFAMGGFAKGTDTVPAMLTPGEFIMSKYAVDSYGLNNMKSLNNGTFSGDSVYNYSVSVNVESDANPDQIAQAVMRQIKQVDSQRIRGNRL